MKRLLLLTALSIVIAISAQAYDFEQHGIYYNYNSYTGEATVTYRDTDLNSYIGAVTIPPQVYYNDGLRNVTGIDFAAFKNSYLLTQVTIPATVRIIGQEAFFGCISLAEVTIPGTVTTVGLKAFGSCSSLATVTLAAGTTTCNFSSDAFAGSDVKHVRIDRDFGTTPFAGITTIEDAVIGSGASQLSQTLFKGCSGLASLSIEDSDNELTLANEILNGTNILTAYVGRNLSGPLFYQNPTLKSVTIGDKVTNLGGEWAFFNCAALESVVIGNGVTAIDKYAFYQCPTLESISLGNSIQSIGYYAFVGCSSLKALTIPASVTSIDGSAFGFNTALADITIEDSATPLECNSSAFGSSGVKRVYIGRNLSSSPFSYNTSIETLTFGDNVTYINRYAFNYCSRLSEVHFGNSLDSIADNAFFNCTALREVTLPNSLRFIGQYAFEGDTTITSLNLGSGLQTISLRAFYGCNKISNLIIPASVTSILDAAFGNTSSLTDVAIEDSDSEININSGAFGGSGVANVYLGRDCPSNPFALSTLRSAIVGDRVKYLSRSAFASPGLQSVTLGESVDSIARAAFNGCTSLTEIVLPDACRYLGRNAFEGCSNLHKVTFGQSMSVFDVDIFTNCSSVDTVVCRMTSAPLAQDLSFPSAVFNNALLMVPRGSAASYRAVNQWKLFARIEEYGELPVKPGDLDGSGTLDGSDVSAMLEIVLSGGTLTPEQIAAADIDGNGTLDGSDVSAILEIVLSGE